MGQLPKSDSSLLVRVSEGDDAAWARRIKPAPFVTRRPIRARPQMDPHLSQPRSERRAVPSNPESQNLWLAVGGLT